MTQTVFIGIDEKKIKLTKQALHHIVAGINKNAGADVIKHEEQRYGGIGHKENFYFISFFDFAFIGEPLIKDFKKEYYLQIRHSESPKDYTDGLFSEMAKPNLEINKHLKERTLILELLRHDFWKEPKKTCFWISRIIKDMQNLFIENIYKEHAENIKRNLDMAEDYNAVVGYTKRLFDWDLEYGSWLK